MKWLFAIVIIGGLIAMINKSKKPEPKDEPMPQPKTPAPGNDIIMRAHGMTLTACKNFGGALCSFIVNGQEYIDKVDSGRLWQAAVQEIIKALGIKGETKNATEGGQGGVFYPDKSASVFKGHHIKNGWLHTTCVGAYWKAFEGRVLSKCVFKRATKIMPWGLHIKSSVRLNDDSADRINLEGFTQYMPEIFEKAEFVNNKTVDLITGSHEHSYYPIIIYTADKKHACACYSRDVDRFSLQTFDGAHHKTQKTSCVLTDLTPDELYELEFFVFVGPYNKVLKNLRLWMSR